MKTAIIFIACGVLLGSCEKDTAVPVSVQLKKVWSAGLVKESSATVYTRGSNTNVKPGYSQYRLDLSSAATARLTEFDGNTFAGQWTLSPDDKTLTISNLTPQPTGTGGTITYTLGSVSESALTLTRTTSSPKSGGTINEYQLVNP